MNANERLLLHHFGARPSGWTVRRLGDFFIERTELSADQEKYPLHSFTIEDSVTEKTDRYERSFLLKDEDNNQFKVVHPGDFVVNPMNLRFGAVGKSTKKIPVTVSAYYDVLSLKTSEIEGDYLLEVLRSQRMLNIYDRVAIGSLLEKKRVHLSIFEELCVFVPPSGELEFIASVAKSWRKSIVLLESLIEAKRERKRALMQQLVTGKIRFAEFVKSSKKVITRYGDFPNDWTQIHMGDIADEAGKKNGGGRELPVLSCTKHRGLVNSLEYFGKRIFSEDTSTYRIVERGDFAYATNHIEEGSIGYQNLHDAALISPMYTVFRTKPGVDHEFFWKLIKTELYRHIFEVNTSGSIARRGALRWDEFALIKVFLPTVPEQKRIATVLNTCDEEIKLLEKQLEALKEQKRGLMQKILTGEVRVKI
jgi:type I restriction enzyme S subunit